VLTLGLRPRRNTHASQRFVQRVAFAPVPAPVFAVNARRIPASPLPARGAVPPVVAAWLPILVFASVGGAWLIRLEGY
jgi:hypothetical protein